MEGGTEHLEEEPVGEHSPASYIDPTPQPDIEPSHKPSSCNLVQNVSNPHSSGKPFSNRNLTHLFNHFEKQCIGLTWNCIELFSFCCFTEYDSFRLWQYFHVNLIRLYLKSTGKKTYFESWAGLEKGLFCRISDSSEQFC